LGAEIREQRFTGQSYFFGKRKQGNQEIAPDKPKKHRKT
jgi:hypothetical protein